MQVIKNYGNNELMRQSGSAFILFILSIAIACIFIIGTSFYIKAFHPTLIQKITRNNINKTSTIIVPSSKNIPVISLVAFVKNNSISDYQTEFQLYDLSSKKIIPVDPTLNSEQTASPSLGPISPDGKYLPIYYSKSRPQKDSLYFYDLEKNKAMKTLDLTENLGSGFEYSTYWKDTNSFVYNTKNTPNSDSNLTSEIFSVSVDGKITQTPGIKEDRFNNKFTYGNNRIKANFNLYLPTAIQTITNINIDNRPFITSIKGEIIGILNDSLITLEKPSFPNLFELADEKNIDPNLAKALQNDNAQEAREAILKVLQPKGDWLIHSYNLADGKLTQSIIAQDNGWFVTSSHIGLLIRPNTNTLLIHQQDKNISPSKSRYTEINPNQPNNRVIISEEVGVRQRNINHFSFEVTQNGNWLIGYEPSGIKTDLHEDKVQIVAWNLDTKEKIVVCEQDCLDLRVYNPIVLYIPLINEFATF